MKRSKKFRVVLEERVPEDFLEALSFYNNISIALGTNFNSKFEYAIFKLSIGPYNYYNLTKKLRRITLGKFPYLLVYKIDGNIVTIIGLFHQASNKKKWRRKK